VIAPIRPGQSRSIRPLQRFRTASLSPHDTDADEVLQLPVAVSSSGRRKSPACWVNFRCTSFPNVWAIVYSISRRAVRLQSESSQRKQEKKIERARNSTERLGADLYNDL